jgi:cell division protein FtsQ
VTTADPPRREARPAEETPARPPANAGPQEGVGTRPKASPALAPTPGLRQATRARRRAERQERRRFTARTRRRRIAWLAGIAGVLVAAGLVVLVALSPLMAVRTIDVIGTSRLDAATVEKALSPQLGRPLPLVDYAVVGKELARFTLIKSYSTESQPPGTLVVRIVERTPVGLLKSGAGYDLVDQAGVVISSSPSPPKGYPLIVEPGKPGTAEAKAGFVSSAAVLAALPPSVLGEVSQITAATEDDVTLTLSSGKTVIWGSAQQSALKAADLGALLKAAPDSAHYDVSSPESPVAG